MGTELNLSEPFPNLGPGLCRLVAELQMKFLSAAEAFGFLTTAEARDCVLIGAGMIIFGMKGYV